MLFSFHCPSCKGKLEAEASLSGSQAACPQCGRAVAVPEARVDAGTTLAGFRLERRLGQGGMGEVYLGTQLSVQRQVAVKVLPPGFAADRDAVQRFLHEGQLAARLDHFNIVTVFEAGEDNGNYYLAMAYIEGESLDQRLKRGGALPEAEALAIIRTIAEALAYAWETFQLLHRDLKPANIMVDRRGRVFLMDLGLAKSLGETTGMTISGTILGTPQYMSPEQAVGSSHLTVQTDIYSLGATLYHLVTGSVPFAGDSVLKVLHQHVHEPLPPPRERNPAVTDACSHLIETMMAKEPAGRYGDWRALLADLDRVLNGALPAVRNPVEPAVRNPVEPAVRSGSAGASAVSPAARQAGLARQAQEALVRQHQAQRPQVAKEASGAGDPHPLSGGFRRTSAKRPSWLAVGLAAAAVVAVLALLGGLARRGRGGVMEGAKKGTEETDRTDGTGAAERPVGAVAPRAAPAPGRPETPIPGQTAAAPAAPVAAPPTASAPPLAGQPWTVPGLGLEMIWVAPGSFQMGSDEGKGYEKPAHGVRISRGFWMGKYEVTQAEYEAITGTNPSQFKGTRLAVDMVPWDEAVAFCTKLAEREQKAGRLPTGYEYRLPTEAEWEYAARGGRDSKGYVYAGSNAAAEVAWYYENSGDRPLDDLAYDPKMLPINNCRTHPVGLKMPNELGLHDLSGNAWEWCLDRFDLGYYARSPETDPVNMQATAGRVARGGGWAYIAKCARSASRYDDGRDGAGNLLGFRVCLGPAVSAATPDAAAAPKGVPAPAEPAAPVAGQTAVATDPAAPDPAQAKLAALVDQVAADLAAGKPAEALRRWQAGCAVAELKPLAEQVIAIGETLREVTNTPQLVLASFKADTSKTVEIELTKEKVTCEVREVTAAGIKATQIVKQGQGTAKLSRTIGLGDLSLLERLRRLGSGDSPELNLQRGLLALEAGRPDTARKLFAKAGGPLGEALVRQVEAQRAEASAAAAEAALAELLRQVCGSPEVGKPAKVTASIRNRCGEDPKRYEDGRRQLAKFEKEWSESEPAKAWVPVLRDALAFPTATDHRWTVPDLGLELVWVAPGSFRMGSTAGESSEKPVHEVRISRGYWLGKYEVTQTEYEAVAGKNPSQFRGARLPVEQVSWTDAVAFCTKLTERERKAGRLPEGYVYRLPTEAEWEYAARGGMQSRGFTYSGSTVSAEVAWYGNGSEDGNTTHPVGQKGPNELGLHDLSGNVLEWCLDWYHSGYYASSPGVDPVNLQAASLRVSRGGAHFNAVGYCRVASRTCAPPSDASIGFGFRACLAPRIEGR